MKGMGFTKLGLEELLDYELRCAKRYRRFVSLIFLSPADRKASLKCIMGDNLLRDCDQAFELEDGFAILMGETDSAGALTALERCQMAAGHDFDLRSAVVSFPFDGHSVIELLSTARRRLERAKETPVRGAVVTTG